jgi:peptidase E
MTRRIVAIGGGGFSTDPDDPAHHRPEDRSLDDRVLALTGVPRPRVLFVPTASGDSEAYRARFHAAFPAERARASVLTLFARDVDDLEAHVRAQDLIYVGGGSTANLLAVWRLHGLDRALRAAYDARVVLAGVSAGMNCWFEASVTDSFGPVLAGLADGLGFLPGSACPHYDGEPLRRPTYRRLVAEGFPAGHAVDDGAALVFTDGEPAEVLSSRAGAGAYRVERHGDEVVERPLPVRPLR